MKWCEYSSLLEKIIVSVQCKPRVIFLQREKQQENIRVMIMAVLNGIRNFSPQLDVLGKTN